MQEKILVTRSSLPSYEEYIEAIKPLWDTHWLTNMGVYHKELEQKLKEYLDVPELSLMVNGHMALEMAVQAFDFPEGSEVITTPFTFISTTHAIVRNRLIPVFCDIKLSDGTIDENKIEELITDKTVAILPVHVYGNICNVEAIQAIADKYNLKVIYDAAHAFGEKHKAIGVGNFGDVSIFSFHATKVFNTIEGGAVSFSDKVLYDKLYNLKNFGIRGEETVVSVGANAKMNEFSAIMGLCNLKNIDRTIEDRKSMFLEYKKQLQDIKGLRSFEIQKETERNYGYFPVVVESDYKWTRDELYEALKAQNIYSRKYFYPLTVNQECYKNKFSGENLRCANQLSERILVLPFYEGFSMEDMERVVSVLKM